MLFGPYVLLLQLRRRLSVLEKFTLSSFSSASTKSTLWIDSSETSQPLLSCPSLNTSALIHRVLDLSVSNIMTTIYIRESISLVHALISERMELVLSDERPIRS